MLTNPRRQGGWRGLDFLKKSILIQGYLHKFELGYIEISCDILPKISKANHVVKKYVKYENTKSFY
jgi:hypothetical protein